MSTFSTAGSVLRIALFLGPTFVLCGAGVVLSWMHWVRVTHAVRPEAKALAIALKRLPHDDRVRALVQKAPQGAWEHRWGVDLAACSGPDARVAVTNEMLAELAHRISTGSRWPISAARISALGALSMAAFALVSGAGVLVVIAVVGTGLGGAVLCAGIGLRAKQAARRQRQAVDALVDSVLGRPVAAGGSARRGRRWA